MSAPDPVRLHQSAPDIFSVILDWPTAALLGPDPEAMRIHVGPGARAAAEAQRARLLARLTALLEDGR